MKLYRMLLVICLLISCSISFLNPHFAFASTGPDLPDKVWNKIRDQIRESAYEVSWDKEPLPFSPHGAFKAYNQSQKLWTYFSSDGVRIISEKSESNCHLGMHLLSYGYEGALEQVFRVEPEALRNRVEYRYGRITEWYVNDERGLEQGFTLLEKPASGNHGSLLVEMSLSGSLASGIVDQGGNLVFKDERNQVILRYGGLKVWDANGRILSAHFSLNMDGVTSHQPKLAIFVDDSDALYPITIDPLVTSEVAKITPSDPEELKYFGYSVAVSGDVMVVGATRDTDPGAGSGAAYLFERNFGGLDNWGEVKKLLPENGAINDNFGHSVSISNDTLVVGAIMGGINDGGSAYIFKRNQGGADNWGQVKEIEAVGMTTGDWFGVSVSIDNDTIAVGTDDESAYVFERNQGGVENWGQVKAITSSDNVIGDTFGHSISISNDTIVVGAYADDDAGTSSGSAYVFSRNQGGADNWGEVKKLLAADGAEDDEFGNSVSICGDIVAVGAHQDDDSGANSGSAYVFSRNQGGADNWGQVKKLADSGTSYFGRSVSVDHDRVAVGVYGSNLTYIFERNKGGVDNWGEDAQIIPSDGASSDYFGESVSISGDTIVVGAYGDDDDGDASGSAYVFNHGGDTWNEYQKPIASDGADGDFFGYSVSISNDTMVVGANRDDNFSGSAYIFSRNQGGADNWGQVTKIIASDSADNDFFGYSVSISNDTVVVGAYRDDDNGGQSGSAYIFSRNQGGPDNWGQVRKLLPSDGVASDEFGYSVSISNDTVVVGAWGVNNTSSAGSAYIFSRNQGGSDNWGEVVKLTASDAAISDYFGCSVSISNDTVVVGAYGDDDNGSASGSAYIFSRNQAVADDWGQVAKITALDGAELNLFGASVSISNDTVVVGAHTDDDNGVSSGSAYIFSRNQGGLNIWGQVAKITASDGAAGAWFGYSVSISNDTVLVGASYDDDIGADSGSAYIYSRNQGGADNWGQVTKITASDGAAVDVFGYSVSISNDTAVVGANYDDDNGADSGSAYIYKMYPQEASDSDTDGMDDQWEMDNFGDLSRDGTGDEEGDLLTDLDEYTNSTDPNDEDSDDDGFYDGEEISLGSVPTDGQDIPTYNPGAYYVDADAVNLGDGTVENPWRVLHHAVHVINNGGPGAYSLYVDAGIYTEIDNDGFEPDESLILTQDNVAVIGAQGAILEGTFSGASSWNSGLEISASNISITGLEIRDFYYDWYYGILVSSGDTISISNCSIINGNYAVSIESGSTNVSVTHCNITGHDRGGITVDDSSATIGYNVVHDNVYGIYIREYSGNNINPVIVNNLIYNTLAWTDYGIVVAADTAISPLIAHNTINGGRYGININGVNSPSMFIQYNIISSFTDYGIQDEGATQSNPVLDYNNVYSSEGGAVDYLNVTAGSTDISEDPFYVDAANGDYHLQMGSPCIDAIQTDDFVTDDLDGNSRPLGNGFDMGAYEQAGNGVPYVISISPTNGAVGMGINSAVSINFSTSVDPTTINASSMMVKTGGTQISGTYSINSALVIFTPDSLLDYGTIYRVRITSDVTDTGGTPLAAAYTGSFTTMGSGAQGAYFPTQAIISIDATTAFSVVAADIDDDGDLDVLSASDDDNTVEWFSNTDGNGTFGAPQTIWDSALGARSVFAGDINGDAIVDVLSASWGPTNGNNPDMEFAWYENAFNAQAAGNFSSQNVLTIHTSPISIIGADMDNDGDMDVLTASYGDNTVAWIENTDGAGGAWTQHIISSSDNAAWDVYPADLDNDGDLDVISASNTSNDVTWYENRLNEASADFGPEIIISNSASGARVVRAADIDQDGDMDVVSASWFDGKIAWYENQGGTFGDPASNQNIIATASENTQAMNVADMDNDGDMDVFYASWGTDHKIAWMENADGSGTTWTSHDISTAVNGCQSLYAADLDGDGDLDVLSASQDDNKIAWYENTNTMPVMYTLTVDQEGQGSVDQNPIGTIFNPDTVVTLTPLAAEGWYFSHWSGSLSGSTNPVDVTMDEDKIVTAVFLQKTPPDPPMADDPPDEETFPAGTDVDISTSDYHDPDGDTHDQTIWEVWRADTEELLPGYQYPDAGVTDHVIPENLLEEGLKYGWRVAYVDSDGNQRWSSEYFFKVGTPEPDTLPTVEAGQSLGDFGMISIVHWPDDPDPQAVFNIDYDPNNYRIGAWDPEADRYIEFGQGLEMEPGRSVWILTRDPLIVNFNGIPVSTEHDIEVCLHTHPSTNTGWNMIAPPNKATYRWNDVMVGRFTDDDDPIIVDPVPVTSPVASTLINHRIWEWEDGGYVNHKLDEDFVLEFYKGYWVKAIVDGVYLVFPMDAQLANLSTPAKIWLAVKGKSLDWIRNIIPQTREAMADNDTPPMPMGMFDDSVDPVFEGCFVKTLK